MDIVFVYLGLYLLVLAGITWFSSRKQNASQYLNSDKKLSTSDTVWTTFASLLTGFNFVLGVTFAYLFGLWYLMAFVGAGLAFLVLYLFYKNILIKLQKHHDLLSVGDYFKTVYGTSTWIITNTILAGSLFLFLVLQMFVNTSLFSSLLGIEKIPALVLTAGIVSFYLWFGGFKTSVKTDIFQGVLMIPIILLIFFFPFHIDIENIGVALDPSQFWFAIGLAGLQFFSLLGQAESFQRIYAARDARSLRKGLMIAFVMLVIIAGVIAYLGINFKFAGVITDPSVIFTDSVLPALPKWLASLLAISLIAAFMGTIDSSSFALGTLVAKLKKAPTKEMYVRLVKYGVIASIILSAVASLTVFSFLSSVFSLISLISLVGAALIFSLLLNPNRIEMDIFLIVGVLVFVLGLMRGFITDNPLTALIPSGIAFLAGILALIFRNVMIYHNKAS